MKTFPLKAKLYISAVMMVGIVVLVYSILHVREVDLLQIAFFILLGALAESLPIVLNKEHVVSVSFAISLASILLFDFEVAILIRFFSAILAIRVVEGKRFHIFNMPLYKVMFNSFARIIVTGASAYSYVIFSRAFPDVLFYKFNLLGIIAVLFTYLIVDLVVYTLLFTFLENKSFIKTIKSKIWMSLNLFGLSPLGVIIAAVYKMQDGDVIQGMFAVILFFGPLLIARYSFKLYLDAKEALNDTINVLSNAMDAKDHYTNGHSLRVAEFCDRIGRQMGMSEKQVTKMHSAAILHDIGKIGIEDQILNKTGKLVNVEFERIKQHPEIGAHILDQVHNLTDVAQIVRYHHVHYNGGGYPEVPEGLQVPIEAYVISVSDAYDAMTSDRPYRKALGAVEATKRIVEGRGTQFHPDVVDAFERITSMESEKTVYVS